MRLFKIQNFVPKLKFFRITKKKDRYPESWIPRIPAYTMSEITPPPLPTLTKVDGCDHPLPGYIFRPVDHVHKSGMPNFAHCRHAVTISSSPAPRHTHLLARTGNNLLAGIGRELLAGKGRELLVGKG